MDKLEQNIISELPKSVKVKERYLMVYTFMDGIGRNGTGNVDVFIQRLDMETILDLQNQVAEQNRFKKVVITNMIRLDG